RQALLHFQKERFGFVNPDAVEFLKKSASGHVPVEAVQVVSTEVEMPSNFVERKVLAGHISDQKTVHIIDNANPLLGFPANSCIKLLNARHSQGLNLQHSKSAFTISEVFAGLPQFVNEGGNCGCARHFQERPFE